MIDQIIIGDKASFDDFGASVAKKALSQPKKKSIKETVPFSNKTYDFTAINGEIYWEERKLEYIFEIIAPTAECLEEMKSAFAGWVMNIIQQPLHDLIIPDYHFIATYEDMSFDDDDGLEKTTASVVFTAYPYKIANYASVYEHELPSDGEKTVWIPNNSGHRISPTITADRAITLELDGASYLMSAGTAKDEVLKLKAGMNCVHIAVNDVIPTRAVGTETINGLAITTAEDGSITINGTATADMDLSFSFPVVGKEGEVWTASFDSNCNMYNTFDFYAIPHYRGGETIAINSVCEEVTTEVNEGDIIGMMVEIHEGRTLTDVTLQPHIKISGGTKVNVSISFCEEVF